MKTKEFKVNGLTMKSSVNENEFDKRVDGTYEEKYVNWFIDNSDDIDIFLDVGAFCGFYGLHMANEGVPVIAFEPSESAFEVLTDNFLNNNFVPPDDFKTYNYPVSNVTGDEIEGGIGGCEFFEPVSDHNDKGNDIVETITIEKALDDYFLDNYSVIVPHEDNAKLAVKIDTEGMELKALIGIHSWWDYIKYLVVEFHPMYVDDNEITKTLNYLENKGFAPLDIQSDPYEENCNIRFERV